MDVTPEFHQPQGCINNTPSYYMTFSTLLIVNVGENLKTLSSVPNNGFYSTILTMVIF